MHTIQAFFRMTLETRERLRKIKGLLYANGKAMSWDAVFNILCDLYEQHGVKGDE